MLLVKGVAMDGNRGEEAATHLLSMEIPSRTIVILRIIGIYYETWQKIINLLFATHSSN